MQIPKASDEERAAFRSLVPEAAGVEIKPMFGNLGAFLRGNMFMGLFGSDIGLKLPESDREALLDVDGAGPFGPAERPMGGYVTIPAEWHTKPHKAKPWIEKSMAFVGALPPKRGSRKT